MEGAKFIVSSIATTSGTKEYFDFIYPFSLDSRLTGGAKLRGDFA
jgi:hypothetical protein